MIGKPDCSKKEKSVRKSVKRKERSEESSLKSVRNKKRQRERKSVRRRGNVRRSGNENGNGGGEHDHVQKIVVDHGVETAIAEVAVGTGEDDLLLGTRLEIISCLESDGLFCFSLDFVILAGVGISV